MGCSWAPQQMQGGIEGRVGLFSLMERAGTLRGGFRGNGPWFRGGVGAGGFSRLGLPKPDFRLGKHLSMGRGGRVWALGGGAASLDPGHGGEPWGGREQKEGPNSLAWSQVAIWPPPHRGFIMARLASGEGARREGAQASGLTSEAHAQVPQTRGASSLHALILSGLWGHLDPWCRKPRGAPHPASPGAADGGRVPRSSSSAPDPWLAGAG